MSDVTGVVEKVASVATVLGLDDDRLSACVSCGLCLPHCPTYRATGEESASPRGRIALMRSVERDGKPIDDDFVSFMQRCVMCRGCETACPSGVRFGELMEQTRVSLARRGRIAPWWLRLGLRGLASHRLLLAGSSALGVVQRVRLLPSPLAGRLGLPARLPIRRMRLGPLAPPGSTPDAYLFTGCVMDAWQRDVHNAALRVMRRAGANVAVGGAGADCCGALHLHAGLDGPAKALADKVIAAFPGQAPVVVDSAGCGAALKDYGHLLGTPEAVAFSARVRDIGEWLAEHLDRLPVSGARTQSGVVAISDPCHLRHVQRAHLPWRAVLSRYVQTVELDDEGRCCGAGGAYSIVQPELATTIRAQKIGSIARSGASVVASANPGCSLWLSAAGVAARHPIEIIDEVLTHGS